MEIMKNRRWAAYLKRKLSNSCGWRSQPIPASGQRRFCWRIIIYSQAKDERRQRHLKPDLRGAACALSDRLKQAWNVNEGEFVAKLIKLAGNASHAHAAEAETLAAEAALAAGLEGEARRLLDGIVEVKRDVMTWQLIARLLKLVALAVPQHLACVPLVESHAAAWLAMSDVSCDERRMAQPLPEL